MSEQVCDIEANGLKPTVIHCIVCKDWNTGDVTKFTPVKGDGNKDLSDFNEFAAGVTRWIGHNFLRYDAKVLRKLLGTKIKPSKITDTLLLSRLQKYAGRTRHGLAAWGDIIPGYKKMPSPNSWDTYTPYMLEYCTNDVELNFRVAQYLKLEGANRTNESSKLEHSVNYILDVMEDDGFTLNVQKATDLHQTLHNKANALELDIVPSSPVWPKYPKTVGKLGVITPKYRKLDGKMSKVGLSRYSEDISVVGGPFQAVDWDYFDLNSPRKKLRWLAPWWSPTVRTKGFRKLADARRKKLISKEDYEKEEKFKWALDETNLATIHADAPIALRSLGEYAMVKSRVDELNGWFSALGDDGRVHGSVQSPGAITHRAGHRSPNVANVPGAHSPYGKECRECWTVDDTDTETLVGTDASGVQMRVLAHHLGSQDYIDTVVNGDVHTRHLNIIQDIIGEEKERHQAKTFIYAYVLGCGIDKTSGIWGVSTTAARKIKEEFPRRVPGLQDHLDELRMYTNKNGYYKGLDGRHAEVKSAHFALSVELQCDESTIMKKAMVDWYVALKKAKVKFTLCNWVHDEWQTKTLKTLADTVGKAQVKSIVDAGVYYNYKCPLDGEYKVGSTWMDTH